VYFRNTTGMPQLPPKNRKSKYMQSQCDNLNISGALPGKYSKAAVLLLSGIEIQNM